VSISILRHDVFFSASPPLVPRWNYKKANWEKIETCTDELTKDIVTEGKSINNVVYIFNASIAKGANESILAGHIHFY
jgi:hypothetical protein